MLKAVGKTDIGNIREINQDDFNCGVLGDDAVFAVVCDGMGGAKAGNVASSMAVKHISEYIINSFGIVPQTGNFCQRNSGQKDVKLNKTQKAVRELFANCLLKNI